MMFADTSYWIAALIRRDGLRERVREVASRLAGVRLVTTDAVLLELLAHVSTFGPEARAEAAGTVEDLLVDQNVTVVRMEPELFARALAMYKARLDKAYSLTDCMGMLICRDLGISEVLTHDRHFQQEGFAILL